MYLYEDSSLRISLKIFLWRAPAAIAPHHIYINTYIHISIRTPSYHSNALLIKIYKNHVKKKMNKSKK